MKKDIDKILAKQRQRFIFLYTIWNMTDGNEGEIIDFQSLQAKANFKNDDMQQTIVYLYGEGLIEYKGLGKHIALSHLGLVIVEKAILKPKIGTEYFLPLNELFKDTELIFDI